MRNCRSNVHISQNKSKMDFVKNEFLKSVSKRKLFDTNRSKAHNDLWNNGDDNFSYVQ